MQLRESMFLEEETLSRRSCMPRMPYVCVIWSSILIIYRSLQLMVTAKPLDFFVCVKWPVLVTILKCRRYVCVSWRKF